MLDTSIALDLVLIVFGLAGWVLYFNENEYCRNVLNDLLQVVYDDDFDRSDLRRSLGHDEVEAALERRNDNE